jgi:hypothetical protein
MEKKIFSPQSYVQTISSHDSACSLGASVACGAWTADQFHRATTGGKYVGTGI